MARFTFRLESVLSYRRGLRDQVQQVLARLLKEDEEWVQKASAVEAKKQEMMDELKQLLSGGRLDVDRAAMRRYHAGVMTVELQVIAQQREVVAENIRRVREVLAKMEQDVRLLEKLKEKQLAEFNATEERRAGREREEAWLGAHWGEFAE